jgi:hypothetical protein
MNNNETISQDIPTANNLDHRKKAEETFRHKVNLMKINYDKRVIPKKYNIGQVIGVLADRRWKTKQATANRVANITGRIVATYVSPETNLIRYQVRTKDFVLNELFRADQLFELYGGDESYPEESKWKVNNKTVTALPRISFVDLFMKLSSETCATIDHGIAQSKALPDLPDSLETYDDICSTCSQFISHSQSDKCKACSSTIHKEAKECGKSNELITSAKYSFCNIYCANVFGYYPTLPNYRSPSASVSSHLSSSSNSIPLPNIQNELGHAASSSATMMCSVCENELSQNDSWMKCFNCKNILHLSSSCPLPKCYYSKNSQYYCSEACGKELLSSEVEIIEEHNDKGYRILFSNGNKSWFKKQKIEPYYEYLRLVLVWRRKQASRNQSSVIHQPLNLFLLPKDPPTPNRPSPSSSSMITSSSPFPTTAPPKSSAIGIAADRCATCNETLSDDNWHRCSHCKKRIHGKIICPAGNLMHQDDDLLFCNACSH